MSPGVQGCDGDAAILAAKSRFQSVRGMQKGSKPSAGGELMAPECPLFARKFPPETAATVLSLFRSSAETGLNLLSEPGLEPASS